MPQSPKEHPITKLVTLGREINPTGQRQRAAAQVWQSVQTTPWSPARAWTSMPRCGAEHLLSTCIPKKRCKNPLSFHPMNQGLVLQGRGTSAGMSQGRLKGPHHAASSKGQ